MCIKDSHIDNLEGKEWINGKTWLINWSIYGFHNTASSVLLIIGNTWKYKGVHRQVCPFHLLACFSHVCVQLGETNKPLYRLTSQTHYNTFKSWFLLLYLSCSIRIIEILGGLGTGASFTQLCFCYFHLQTKLSSHLPVFFVTIFWSCRCQQS